MALFATFQGPVPLINNQKLACTRSVVKAHLVEIMIFLTRTHTFIRTICDKGMSSCVEVGLVSEKIYLELMIQRCINNIDTPQQYVT